MFLSLLNSLVVWRSLGSEDRAMLRWSREQQLSTRAMRARLRAVALAAPLEVAGPVFVVIAFILAVVTMPGTRWSLVRRRPRAPSWRCTQPSFRSPSPSWP